MVWIYIGIWFNVKDQLDLKVTSKKRSIESTVFRAQNINLDLYKLLKKVLLIFSWNNNKYIHLFCRFEKLNIPRLNIEQKYSTIFHQYGDEVEELRKVSTKYSKVVCCLLLVRLNGDYACTNMLLWTYSLVQMMIGQDKIWKCSVHPKATFWSNWRPFPC